MSTAIREAAPETDDRPDKTDPSTDCPSGRTASRHDARSQTPSSVVRRTEPTGATNTQHEPCEDIGVELLTMLEHSLRMLPRALLEPVVAASCPWFGDLPPAAARQCLGDLQDARLAGDVSSVLLQWRRRARPFAS